MSDIVLISPYSLRVLRRDKYHDAVCQHPYRAVEDFPESWEPISQAWQETLDPLPAGEYCYTTAGIYQRKVECDE